MSNIEEIKSVKRYIRHLKKQIKEAELKWNDEPEKQDTFIKDTEQTIEELKYLIELLEKAQ